MAALGPRNTTGYDMSVACVRGEEASGDLQVFVTEYVPAP